MKCPSLPHLLRPVVVVLLAASGFCITPSALCQNLVQNPGFEEFDGGCSDVQPWELSTWAAPECGGFSGYYNACNNASMPWAGVPANGTGYESAHSGQAYTSINTFEYTDDDGNPRMYLSVDLTEPLVAGQEYCLGLWMSLAEQSSFRTSTLHAFLWYGHPSMCNGNDSLWDANAVITFNTSEVDTAGWYLLESSFTASGAEANLTLGSFLFGDEIDTTFLQWHLPPYTASYYIDDVYLGSCDGIGLIELPQPDFHMELYPVPVAQGGVVRVSIRGTNNELCTMAVFDMAGLRVLPSTRANGLFTISTANLAPGTYLVVASTPQRNARRLLVIQ